jgi:hypothetical protein
VERWEVWEQRQLSLLALEFLCTWWLGVEIPCFGVVAVQV